ncbi:hypothetical protein DIPPA_14407 [Diplonema papillatum]|nr:hypothetical protein DIPPA_14407 [Diplonema papillatum]
MGCIDEEKVQLASVAADRLFEMFDAMALGTLGTWCSAQVSRNVTCFVHDGSAVHQARGISTLLAYYKALFTSGGPWESGCTVSRTDMKQDIVNGCVELTLTLTEHGSGTAAAARRCFCLHLDQYGMIDLLGQKPCAGVELSEFADLFLKAKAAPRDHQQAESASHDWWWNHDDLSLEPPTFNDALSSSCMQSSPSSSLTTFSEMSPIEDLQLSYGADASFEKAWLSAHMPRALYRGYFSAAETLDVAGSMMTQFITAMGEGAMQQWTAGWVADGVVVKFVSPLTQPIVVEGRQNLCSLYNILVAGWGQDVIKWEVPAHAVEAGKCVCLVRELVGDVEHPPTTRGCSMVLDDVEALVAEFTFYMEAPGGLGEDPLWKALKQCGWPTDTVNGTSAQTQDLDEETPSRERTKSRPHGARSKTRRWYSRDAPKTVWKGAYAPTGRLSATTVPSSIYPRLTRSASDGPAQDRSGARDLTPPRTMPLTLVCNPVSSTLCPCPKQQPCRAAPPSQNELRKKTKAGRQKCPAPTPESSRGLSKRRADESSGSSSSGGQPASETQENGRPAKLCKGKSWARSLPLPCKHNTWDSVRIKRGWCLLRCRTCEEHGRILAKDLPKRRCVAFAEEACVDPQCTSLHIFHRKKRLEERMQTNPADLSDKAQYSKAGLESEAECYELMYLAAV